MDLNDKWINFEDVNFYDKEIKSIHIDTRDFHCTYKTKYEGTQDKCVELDKEVMDKISNLNPSFFYSDEQAKDIVSWLFHESGGRKKWRHIVLTGRGEKVSNGWLKYLRLYRTDSGWVIFNRDSSMAISKGVFSESTINKEHLNAF